MRDLDEVIHFRPSPDNRSAEGGTVNRDVRSQLDIIFDDHRPDLGDLMMAALMLEIAEAVAADDCPGMDDDPVADRHTFTNCHIRIQQAVLADDRAFADEDSRIEPRSPADRDAVI